MALVIIACDDVDAIHVSSTLPVGAEYIVVDIAPAEFSRVADLNRFHAALAAVQSRIRLGEARKATA